MTVIFQHRCYANRYQSRNRELQNFIYQETSMTPDFNTGLDKNSANYAALTPLDYISRAAAVYGNRLAIAHGAVRQTWRET